MRPELVPSPARVRGQATVETALGILVFVTVLVFGIHFAEIGYLSLKVTEAQMFAVWNATGRKTAVLPDNFAPRTAAIGAADGVATARYRDFDGRTASTGTSITQVFTTSTGPTVTCAATNVLPDLDLTGVESAVLGPSYGNGRGGMQCSASATLTVAGMPTKYLEGGGGLFKAKHVKRMNYTICGTGRAWGGGACQGKIGILLGDWGLTNGTENDECALGAGPCANGGYYTMVNTAFSALGAGQGGAASALASLVAGSSPIDENAFWMSFRGEESGFQETVPGSHSGDDGPRYTVTPGGPYEAPGPLKYPGAYGGRQPCFLGAACN